MAGKTAILAVRIISDETDARKGFDKTAAATNKLSAGMKKATIPAAAITTGLIAAGKATGDLAAAAEQNVGAVNTVFGDAGATVIGYSKTAANAVGLSASSYNELAASVGGSLKSTGMATDKMAAKTKDMIAAASDLSSVFGGTTAEATGAMGAALRGEFDSLERFGVFMNMNAVNARLAANGQDKLTGAALDSAKKQTITNMIMEQAGQYAGNFAREADTAAGAQQRANAQWEDAQAKLGEALLPAMTAGAQAMAAFSNALSANAAVVVPAAVAIGALAVGVLAYNGVMAALPAIQAASTAAQWLWNAAMSANPIGIVIIAVAALVAGIVWLWNNVEGFRNFVTGAWTAIVAATLALANGIKAAWNAAVSFFTGKAASGIGTVIGFFANMPGRVGGIMRGMAGVLVRAGLSIMSGLLGGLKRGFNAVKNFVGGIASWIANHKGPLSYDRVLLKPAGNAIMDGLNNGLQARMPALRRQLNAVTSTIKSVGTDAGTVQLTAGGNGSGGAASVVNNYYNIDMSGLVGDKLALAREIQNLLDKLARSQGRKVGAVG